LSAKDNALSKLLAADLPDKKLVEETFLSCLARRPTAAEEKKFLKTLQGAKGEERRLVVEDLHWALLSSREFLFNH
jgi:hypothetical protein